MKITRTGAYRRAGTVELFSENIAKLVSDRWKRPRWNAALGELHFDAYGSDRGSRYNYVVTVSAADLIALLQLASSNLPDVASRALTTGALCSIHELLVPKES